MALTNLGKVCITPKGAWSGSTAYEILDVVSSAGASYLAKTAVPAGTALSNTTYWLQLCAKGETGNGIASIEKTGTSGNIDTYTITYTNGDTFDFTVANSLIPDDVVAEYYDTTKSYSPGDYVLYNGGLYRCIESATGAWDGDKWVNTSIGADLTLIYAKKNGYYQLMTVGYADNLTPYSADSGTSQNTPFILQGSGCANGEEQADTGSYCQLQRKNGNTVTVNQARTTRSGSYNGSATQYHGIGNEATYLTYGHVYLVMFNAKIEDDNETPLVFAIGNAGYNQYQMVVANGWNCKAAILSDTFGTQVNDSRFFITETGLCHFSYSDLSIIDLVQWFGSESAIPAHLWNSTNHTAVHPEDFFRYYQGDLSYNVATLTDCNGRYLKTTGRNVWDEQWEVGGIIGGVINSKNYIKCIPNAEYYLYAPYACAFVFYDSEYNALGPSVVIASNRTFTPPANAIFMKFYVSSDYGTTYNHDITISLYYEGESGYDQYYPYEELANIDTGNEPLLAFDYKTPDGVVHKNTGKVDLGTFDYTKADTSSGHWRFQATLDEAAMPESAVSLANVKCGKYASVTPQDTYLGVTGVTINYYPLSPSHSLIICDETYTDAATFKAAMSGIYLEYELVDSEKTTEQGTPFPENVAIDDFGTMAFDCPNGVPQGNLVFYPVDYKAEIDTLHNITDGDMHKIALKGDLAEGEPETIEEVVDYINARIPAPPAEDGTYNLTVTVASGEATYSWVSAT